MSEAERKNLVATLKKISDDWEYHSKDGRISCRLNREFELEFNLAEMKLRKYDKVKTLERQLAEAREIVKETVNKNCSQCVHNYNNGDGWCGDCNEQLKEQDS